MPSAIPDAEYAKAKAEYKVALDRLKAAKAALPPKPDLSPYQQQRAHEQEAIWQAYIAGARDYKVLGAMFGHSRGWAYTVIQDRLRERQLGPPSPWDYAFDMGLQAEERGDHEAAREWFKDMDWQRYRHNRQCPRR